MKKIDLMVRNPLGIIALFVTFVDGIAGLVVGVNIENLHGPWERIPLIYFVVLFPILVFLAFLYLVIKKPLSLFGPGDFDNQDKYIEAMSKVLRPNKEPKPLKKPEKIRVQKNNKSWSFISYSSFANSSNLLDNIVDTVLQRYADEHDLEIKTEVRISHGLVCDGVAEKQGQLCLFEVKTNYNSAMANKVVKELCYISEAMASKGCENLCMVLILVSKDEVPSQALENLRKEAENIIPKTEILTYTKTEISNK